jgi:hypothetical protein
VQRFLEAALGRASFLARGVIFYYNADMRSIMILGSVLFISSSLFAQGVRDARLDGVEFYGAWSSDPGALAQRFFGPTKRWLGMEAVRTRSGQAAAAQAKKALEAAVRKEGGFSSVLAQKVSSTTVGEVIVVFDVVERKDAANRAAFRVLPKSKARAAAGDPAGLLAAWNSYYEGGWDLVRKGSLSSERVQCPAFYCTWGDATPELKALQDRFREEVPQHQEKLARIAAEDPDPMRRSAALCLSTYLRSAREVVQTVSQGLTDPDERVREAALRVFADIALYRREIDLPVKLFLAAADRPSVAERNRVLAVFLALADHPRYRQALIYGAEEPLLRMMRMRNAADHDMADTVLRILSGESYGRDYAAWKTWFRKAREGSLPQK